MKKNYILDNDYALALYLKEVGKIPTLTMEEEAELARKIKKGDRKALDKLVEANLRFVVSVAINYQNQGLPLSDLINEGNLGLIKAATKFDETKNFKFISYAVWWIRQAILQALAEQSRIVKLPLNRIDTLQKINKIRSKLEQKYRRAPDNEEIASELSIDMSVVEESCLIGNNAISLHSPCPGGNDETPIIDLIPNKEEERPDSNYREISLQEEIKKIIDFLDKREREVIKLYFGIDHEKAYTLEEISKFFNLTRERARQIKEKALKRLKFFSLTKRRLVTSST
ncbi:MAG: RNA polymerase sigma factor RpoD/SigA [Chitinispirillaceae bacterium]|nr:RNA polymerase sigma factor RpoD/SigA [Chitinispirillaceae bacterium]